jgi:hypothetical protein
MFDTDSLRAAFYEHPILLSVASLYVLGALGFIIRLMLHPSFWRISFWRWLLAKNDRC